MLGIYSVFNEVKVWHHLRQCEVTGSWSTSKAWMDMKLSLLNHHHRMSVFLFLWLNTAETSSLHCFSIHTRRPTLPETARHLLWHVTFSLVTAFLHIPSLWCDAMTLSHWQHHQEHLVQAYQVPRGSFSDVVSAHVKHTWHAFARPKTNMLWKQFR